MFNFKSVGIDEDTKLNFFKDVISNNKNSVVSHMNYNRGGFVHIKEI